MATFNYFLDKVSDPSIPSDEAKAILREYRKAKKPYPNKVLNPNRTSLYLVAILGKGKQFKVKTPFKVSPRDWNFNKGEIKASFGPEYYELNLLLKELHMKVENHFREQIKTGSYSLPSLKNSFEQILNGIDLGNNSTVTEHFSSFLESQSSFLSTGTLKEYNTAFLGWRTFENSRKKRFVFEEINSNVLEDFESFLLTKTNRTTKKNIILDDTIAKYVSNIRAYLKWAQKRGLHANSAYLLYSPRIKRSSEKQIVTLTKEELKRLYTMDLSNNERLDRVRDLFCFSCFTGQRWGDVIAFNKSNYDPKNNVWIFKAQKTGKLTKIPLIGFAKNALDILAKYDFSFPKISSQKANKYLKELGQQAEINQTITIERYSGLNTISIIKPKYEYMSFHMARRTCVTLLLESEASLLDVRRITRHSDIRTLMKYENTDDSKLEETFNKLSL